MSPVDEQQRRDPRVSIEATRCPYCHASVAREGEQATVCAACLAPHHAGCWQEHGACSSCGAKAPLFPEAALVRVFAKASRPGLTDGQRALVLVAVLAFSALATFVLLQRHQIHDLEARNDRLAEVAVHAPLDADEQLRAARAEGVLQEKSARAERVARAELEKRLEAEKLARTHAEEKAAHLDAELHARQVLEPDRASSDETAGTNETRDTLAAWLLRSGDDAKELSILEDRRRHPTSDSASDAGVALLADQNVRAVARRLQVPERAEREGFARSWAISRLVDARGSYAAIGGHADDLVRIEAAYWSLVRGEPFERAAVLLDGGN